MFSLALNWEKVNCCKVSNEEVLNWVVESPDRHVLFECWVSVISEKIFHFRFVCSKWSYGKCPIGIVHVFVLVIVCVVMFCTFLNWKCAKCSNFYNENQSWAVKFTEQMASCRNSHPGHTSNISEMTMNNSLPNPLSFPIFYLQLLLLWHSSYAGHHSMHNG